MGLFILSTPVALAQEAEMSSPPGQIDEQERTAPSTLAIQQLLVHQDPTDKVTLKNRAYIERFYASKNYAPVWTNQQDVTLFLQALTHAPDEGLEASAYNLSLLMVLNAQTKTPEEAAAFEILLTDAFFRYSADLRVGRLSPKQAEGADNWKLEVQTFDPASYLEQALSSNTLTQALADLPPPHAEYAALRSMLREYREKAAAMPTWPVIADGPKLEAGMSDPRVPTLRDRLRLTGELPEGGDMSSTLMDSAVVAALKQFQADHGLLDDGVLGKRAITALNMSPKHRVLQIIANMERWRWLPREMELTRIMINIPGQELDVFDENAPVMSMRIIVGSRTNKTPSLRSKVTSLTLNPTWTLPYSIASKEVLPKLKKNPNYLHEQDMHIVEGEEYPEFVDWTQYGQRNFPYTIRQAAGARNPLGLIKFNMPNSDDIYLHDTNNRGLFSRSDRALSHGCIRLQQPMDLALFTLRNQSRWSKETLTKAIDTKTTQSVMVPSPVPVYLLYWTAWKDAKGTTQFREDIYGRDQRLLTALAKISPSIMAN